MSSSSVPSTTTTGSVGVKDVHDSNSTDHSGTMNQPIHTNGNDNNNNNNNNRNRNKNKNKNHLTSPSTATATAAASSPSTTASPPATTNAPSTGTQSKVASSGAASPSTPTTSSNVDQQKSSRQQKRANGKKKNQPSTNATPPPPAVTHTSTSQVSASISTAQPTNKQSTSAAQRSKGKKNSRPQTAPATNTSNGAPSDAASSSQSKTASSSLPSAGSSPQPAQPTRPPQSANRIVSSKATSGTLDPTNTSTNTPTRTPIAHRPSTGAPSDSSHPSVIPPSLTSASAASSSIHAPASKQDIIVLKVGSASLSADDCKLLHLSNICNLVDTICKLKQSGYQVILVTSGAVAVGCQRLGLTERPKQLVTKQAVAAIGQSRLMRLYDDLFSSMSQPIAQVLLTRENLSKHHHYVNALNTFRELLRLNIVPIVNENDTVSISELKLGDNDTLSAMVASLTQAKWLFLLTDVSGLYDSDPRSNPNAKIVHTVNEIDELNVSLGSSGSIGTGGMTTKLVAASIATAAGVHTGIIKSTELQNIHRMMRGELVGTHFLPSSSPLKAHKKWIAHGLAPEGEVVIDEGATRAILEKKSLFAPGVVGICGTWRAGANVRLMRAPNGVTSTNHGATSSGTGETEKEAVSSSSVQPSRARIYTPNEIAQLPEVGKCVVQYSSEEFFRLAGQQSDQFSAILGYEVSSSELAHRENIVVTGKGTNKIAQTQQSSANSATTATTVAVAAAAPSNTNASKKRERRQKKQQAKQVTSNSN